MILCQWGHEGGTEPEAGGRGRPFVLKQQASCISQIGRGHVCGRHQEWPAPYSLLEVSSHLFCIAKVRLGSALVMAWHGGDVVIPQTGHGTYVLCLCPCDEGVGAPSALPPAVPECTVSGVHQYREDSGWSRETLDLSFWEMTWPTRVWLIVRVGFVLVKGRSKKRFTATTTRRIVTEKKVGVLLVSTKESH